MDKKLKGIFDEIDIGKNRLPPTYHVTSVAKESRLTESLEHVSNNSGVFCTRDFKFGTQMHLGKVQHLSSKLSAAAILIQDGRLKNVFSGKSSQTTDLRDRKSQKDQTSANH